MATAKRNTRKKKEASILDAINNLQPETIVEEIGNLQNTLQGTLAGLSAKISSKVEQMKNVDEAISIKQAELEELYDIEKDSMSLETVREKRMKEDEEWQRQVDRRNSDWQEEADEQDKKFQRLEEEQNYSHTRRVAQAESDFSAKLAEKRKQESFRLQDLERSWAEREDQIASQEQEFSDLKAQVESFDDRLKAEVGKAEAIIGNKFKRDHQHQLAMLTKDMEASENLSVAKIESLNSNIASLVEQIDDLQRQLTEARNDAKEVTSQALHSASGRQAMDAMQRVVDSSGQTTKK